MTNTIKPRDLRINNWVQSKEWEGYGQVQGIEISNKGFEIKINGYIHICSPEAYFDLELIPLTEEILVKAGFVKSTDTNWQYQLGVGGINMYCRYNTEWYFELGGIYMGARPKYLNELQNIFHAMSGRELEIKL